MISISVAIWLSIFPCKAQRTGWEKYAELPVERLEKLVNQYEMAIERKLARRKLQEPIHRFYEGEHHELTIYNLMEVVEEVGLSNQLFVLAQAVVETGHFRSRVCKEDNNLFGLRNPRTGSYYRFDSWESSVVAYQKFVQYKYKGGNYLAFLRRIGYAESPHYTHEVAKVAKQLYEQLSAEGKL